MNEKIKSFIVFGFAAIFATAVILSGIFTGCKSTKLSGAASNSVLEYQAEIGRLESENEYLRERIDYINRTVEDSQSRAESIQASLSESVGEVDEIINRFDEYQRGVQLLLEDYNRIRNATQTVKKELDNNVASDNSSNSNLDSN